ncbi:MAG: DUF4112 domain-containing protein [Halolamina sp.]
MSDRADLAESFAELDAEALPESVDEAAVERMRVVATLLDEAVTVPGTDVAVGLDPLLGVVPGVGDAVSGLLSLYIVAESARLGVPYSTLLRMLGNVGVDVVGGSVPYVGTVVDALWRANARNLRLALASLVERTAADAASERDGAGTDGDDEPVAVDIEVE